MHRRLLEQLQRAFDGEKIDDAWLDGLDPTLRAFVDSVSERYAEHDAELERMQKQLERTTSEILDRNEALRADIARRERVEAELRSSRRRLEFQRERMPLGLIEWDRDWRVVDWNPAAERIFGWTRQEMLGTISNDRIVPEADRASNAAIIEQLLSGSGGQHHINRNLRRDGATILCEWFNTTLYDDAGKPVGVASIVKDVTQRLDWERRLLDASNRDGLTGLPNRRCFMGALDEARLRPGDGFSLLFIDLDRFKAINDSMGHGIGDLLLKAVADRLMSIFRDQDMVGRLGGDEFAVLLGGVADPKEAMIVASRVGDILRRPFGLAGKEVLTSASIGVAMSARRHTSAEDLLRDADVAMYRAKESGRARHVLFDRSIHRQVVRRLQVENELHRAAELAQLRLVYQPIVTLDTRRVVAFEALLRWRHPQWGEVSPSEFVPIAEDTGRILDIGAWVIDEACRRLGHWGGSAADDFYLTINISARQLADESLVRLISDSLTRYALSPGQLGIEITETSVLQGRNAARSLGGLRELGVRLLMDDFGTGWSSLANLLHLELDAFKIDRGFVSGGHQRRRDFLRAILLLSRSIGRPAVAEGIETQEQLDLLRELGAEFGQGFLFGRPMEAGEVPACLDTIIEPRVGLGAENVEESKAGFAPPTGAG